MRLANRIIDFLIEKEVRKIFGIPGIGNQVLLDAMYGKKQLEFVLTRHEQAAAIMADCWGRLNGEVGVCMASFVAGTSNLINGIAQAFQAKSPVLALVGETSQERNDSSIDLSSLFKPITKLSMTVKNAEDALPFLEKSFNTALSEPKGPVYLGIPVDIQTTDVDDSSSEKKTRKHITKSADLFSSSHLNPLSVAKFLSNEIPKDAIVTVDVGNHMVYISKTFKEFNLITSGSLYSMGFAFPAALAAKISYPGKTVYCITGDGGFSMVMQELETAVRKNLKIIIIVFNNQCLGMIRSRQEREFDGRFIGTNFEEIDFSLVAKSFGADGERVDSLERLESALHRAKRQDKSFLIDIMVNLITSSRF